MYSLGVLNNVRALSNSTLTDTCNYYRFQTAQTLSNPLMHTTGDVQEVYDSAIVMSCRVDEITNDILTERTKASIDVAKLQRFIYLSLDDLVTNGITPKLRDKIETNAGSPNGELMRFRVVSVDTETDEIDVILLIEVM